MDKIAMDRKESQYCGKGLCEANAFNIEIRTLKRRSSRQAEEIQMLKQQLDNARNKLDLYMDSGEWIGDVYSYKDNALDALEAALAEQMSLKINKAGD